MTSKELLAEAEKARTFSYSPYSHFAVGAAVLAGSGKIYSGCNIENSSYGMTNCAERTAIFKAVSEGEKNLIALAVTADTDEPVSPCGACRQVMAEFKINKIIMGSLNGKIKEMALSELLPFSFGKEMQKDG